MAQTARIRRAGSDLVLVSVDDGWPAINRFFGGAVPKEVSRAASDDYRRITTGILPETIVVDAAGIPVQRVRGPQDWSTASAATFLESLELLDD